jgi:hypothetical protein
MTPLFYMHYHGDVSIAYWEYTLAVVYIVVLYLNFARKKNLMIKQAPEYKYYLWGFLAKIFAGLVFSLIYFYYYEGGDTTAFFYSAVAMRNMAVTQPMEYISQMFGDNTMEAWSRYTLDTARPYQYVFLDDRTFVVLQVTSILAILTFKSYLITTLIIASISFYGIWACYRTFVSYYPQLMDKLAIAFLFMPSAVFWGSAILKDTFSFSAVCFWVHAVDEIFYKRRNVFNKSVVLVLSAFIMLMVKPYIFMVMFPATLLWLLYFRVVRIRNMMVKFVLVPLAGVSLVALSIFVLTRMEDMLDKFALDGALETIQTTQQDMVRSESYGSNSFDVGEFDGTWLSVLSKFPVATNAALFRPYLWESRTAVIMMSGLENFWVLGLTVFALFRAGPRFFLRSLVGVPLLLMSMTFALLFAFTVGVTTPNFGALVRFKIPMIPFYISSLYIIIYLAKLKRKRENQGLRFTLDDLRMGTAHLEDDATVRKKRRAAGRAARRNGLQPA